MKLKYYFTDGRDLFASNVKHPRMGDHCICVYDPINKDWATWAVVDTNKLKLLTRDELILEML